MEALQSRGGVMEHSDLAANASTFPQPISTTYRGLTGFEIPPPTQGSREVHLRHQGMTTSISMSRFKSYARSTLSKIFSLTRKNVSVGALLHLLPNVGQQKKELGTLKS